MVGRRGKPQTVVIDNGSAVTRIAILKWSQDRRIGCHYIAPNKPTRKALHRTLQRASA